ncbi:MAG TPA: alkaline phosphatase family protein [Sphingomicrobium sp.]|nr:alkaline phosphatase family protein [Sphingomicrobium sp.]
MRSLLLRLVSTLCFLSASPVPAAPQSRPKLIVAISVDQFAASVYARYRNDYSGGLKRVSSGVAFPVGYQSHAATETCPGHSTLLTGDHPSHTGIIANNWFDRSAGTSVYCAAVAGTGEAFARGPQMLKATTLGDWLKQKYPRSRVVSISGKDRAAIMMAGHHPDLVAWWMDGSMNDKPVFGFQTSRFAGPAGSQIQSILKKEDDKIAASWRTAPPQLWPGEVPADCTTLERSHRFGDLEMTGSVPPELALEATAQPGFIGRKQFYDALHSSPLFDSVTLDFAAELAKRWKLGTKASPDLLAISLSATDYVGHRYGNGGAEMCAQVHALDRSLGKFLARIDRLGVPYVVVLTADHGSVDAPERLQEQGVPAQRVDTSKFVGALNAHLKQLLNISWKPITADDPQQLYLISADDPAFFLRIRTEAVSWLKQQPNIDSVLTRDEVAAAVPPPGKSAADLTIAERINESFDPERSADIFVVFKKFATLGWPRGPNDSVAGHGSPWDYDRQVPILFWWPGAPSLTSPAPAETVDIAPTLAAIIGIAPPAIDGHCRPEVAKCAGGPVPAPASGERGR